MGGLTMVYVYVITEDVYLWRLRGVSSHIAIHDTLKGAEGELDSYFVRKEYMDGYRTVDELTLDSNDTTIVFTKWRGILKRVLRVSRQPLKE